MLGMNSLKVLAAATMVLGIASNASAECKFDDGGIVQNNHLTRFNTNLNGEAQYKKTFTDTAMAGKKRTVTAVGQCDAIVYEAKGPHIRIKSGKSGDVPADARGVGCQCKG